jgi:ribosomal protein L15
MDLSQLPSTTTKSKRRLGRGYGSRAGGHTVGRGQKGQKSRTKLPLLFTGTKNKKSLIQRLPKKRGKNKFKSLTRKPTVIYTGQLNAFKPNSIVTTEAVVKAGLLSVKTNGSLKLLVKGKLSIPLEVAIPVSDGARVQIEQAGGKVINHD